MDDYTLDISEVRVDNQTSTVTNGTASNSSSSTSSSSSSIVGTYALYFNEQSYLTSIIVVCFISALFGWMVVVFISSCVYRHALERFLAPEDYNARKYSSKIKHLKFKEEEELMEKMQEHEHGHREATAEDIEAKVKQLQAAKKLNAADIIENGEVEAGKKEGIENVQSVDIGGDKGEMGSPKMLKSKNINSDDVEEIFILNNKNKKKIKRKGPK